MDSAEAPTTPFIPDGTPIDTASLDLGPSRVTIPLLEDVDPVQLRAVQESLLDPSLVLRAVRRPDGSIVDFRCEDANEAACASLTVPRNELVGASLLETMSEALGTFFLEQCIDTLESGEPLAFDDLRLSDPVSGRVTRVDARAVAVGERVCFAWRDVTRRHDNDEALTESLDRYRLLAENSSDVVVLLTPVGIVDWVSPAVREMLGWSPEEMAGRPAADFVLGDDLERELAFRPHPATVRDTTVEVRCRRAGGGTLWVSARIRNVSDDDGGPVGVIVSMRDVDEQVQSRLDLEASEERYRLLAENVTDVVYQSLDGRFVWISPSIEHVLGWRPGELIGRAVMDLVVSEDVPDARRIHEEVRNGVTMDGIECRIRTASGGYRWMRARARRLGSDATSALGIVVGMQDIHEDHASRRALDALDAANAALVGTPDEDTLLGDVCRVVVDEGGFAGAWYGTLVNRTGGTVACVASSGSDGPGRTNVLGGDGSPEPITAACASIRSGSTEFGYRSSFPAVVRDAGGRGGPPVSVALPVSIDGEVDGVLIVHDAEGRAFGPSVVATLEQLAHQMGLALSRVRTRDRLMESLAEQNLLSTAIEQASETVVVIDLDARIVYANPATSTSSGYDLDEIIGSDPRMFSSGLHGEAFFEEIGEALRNGETWRGVVVSRTKWGELYEEDSSVTPVYDEHGEPSGYVSVRRNISRELALEADLDRLRCDRTSVVQAMNGVRVGSTLEASAASFCQAVTRLENLTVARVLLVESDSQVVPLGITGRAYLDWEVGVPVRFPSLGEIFDRTRQGPWWASLVDIDGRYGPEPTIVAPMLASGFVSVGFAPIWWDTQFVGLLVVASRAEESERWTASRATVLEELSSFAGTVLGPQVSHRGEWRAHRDAIRAVIDEGAFVPVFQPVVDLYTDEVLGYEALTRFADGTRPDLVMEDAHAVGLGVELETACAVAAVRDAVALPAGAWLAVNLSPSAVIAGAVATAHAMTDRPLVVEITEHVEVQSYVAVRSAIGACPGVRTSVDDAGAGYASLRHILELQPDFVKLDIGLVRNIDVDPARQALAAGLHHYAVQTGNTLIAEGVETAAERAVLQDLGIPLGQGYLFGRPSPAPMDREP